MQWAILVFLIFPGTLPDKFSDNGTAVAISDTADHCRLSDNAARAANLMAQTPAYDSAVASLKKAQLNTRKEHAVSFGKDAAGNIVKSPISDGHFNNGYLPDIESRIADMHIHTNEQPPSSGDLHGFIDQIAIDSGYRRYIITPLGSAYALVLINNQKAFHFNTSFPRTPGVKHMQANGKATIFQPTFPQQLVDGLNQLKSWHGLTQEMAFAFLLKKYNTGIALLKQNTSGNYTVLEVKEQKGVKGTTSYQMCNCACHQ